MQPWIMTTRLGSLLSSLYILFSIKEATKMDYAATTYTQLFQNYPDVVSTVQLSEMLGVCEKTVYQLLMTNQIKHFRIGRAYRIPKVNVIAFMESESTD